MLSQLNKTIFSLGILTLFLLSSFGVLHMTMSMGPDGRMDPCPFSPSGSICTMTPLEHISATQSMFSALPQQKNIFSLLLLLISGIALLPLFLRLFSPPKLLYSDLLKNRRYTTPRNFLQEAYSRGILNPKTF